MAQAASSELGQSASKHFPTATSTDENAISAYFTGDGENQDQDNDEADFPDEDEESEELGEDELFLEDREYDEEEAIFLQACHSAYADVRKAFEIADESEGLPGRLRQPGEGAQEIIQKGLRTGTILKTLRKREPQDLPRV